LGSFCLVSLTKYSGILLAQLSNIKQIQILEGSEKEFLFRCPHTSGQFVAPEMMEMDSGKIQFPLWLEANFLRFFLMGIVGGFCSFGSFAYKQSIQQI